LRSKKLYTIILFNKFAFLCARRLEVNPHNTLILHHLLKCRVLELLDFSLTNGIDANHITAAIYQHSLKKRATASGDFVARSLRSAAKKVGANFVRQSWMSGG